MNMNYICVIYGVYSIYFIICFMQWMLKLARSLCPADLCCKYAKKPKAERDTTTTTITAAAAAGQRLVLHCVWICGSGEEEQKGRARERGGSW